MKPHQKLNAWADSFELVKELYAVTKALPPEEKFGLVSQIRRAAVSVPVNIAEGAARKSPKQFAWFLYVSLGSLTELDTLILLCGALEFIPPQECTRLVEKMDIIGKMIYGLIKSLEK
ncbi:four helix bundle protein [Niabella drilacis]|uniref:Four helix bundle protein n=1 Tax=Niabella drilacis (strain DSM 25811 / CCM 8410 / CCUG 62505 / LMG 26954 / E90) TaxID=1285928 RepID=A0A1G6J8C8_NIADE|nr:four helix bundle protein [Niabella drilacis]SDC14813.1 four helix bundle protein [Niabella drilacis]